MSRVIITEGDPAGVGREIILKALADKEVRSAANPIIAGSREDFEETFELLLERGILKEKFELEYLNCNPKYLGKVGEINGDAGRYAFNSIKSASELIKAGKARNMATAPINKQSLKAGGVPFIGHTEILASLTESYDPLTVFETGNLRIFFFTRHIAFADISSRIKEEKLVEFIKRVDKANRALSESESPMAVAALNPHGGDGGLMGNEESEIKAAVKRAVTENINVLGPVPADSVFYECLIGKYSAVLSLYHDQGHIAAKTLDFNGTISLTAGLPFLRTSPDHGTAFDIAGKGIANEKAMKLAIMRAATAK